MNVLVIGKGGREHAICWAVNDDPKVNTLYAYPGNPGIFELSKARKADLQENATHEELAQWAKNNSVELTIVGPEDPLNKGISDTFKKLGLKIFGPSQKAAQLEASKQFAKNIMQKANIPTGSYEIATTYEDAEKLAQKVQYPHVLKYDGLAAGKGVVICQSAQEALDFCHKVFNEHVFSKNPDPIIFEEFLDGPELSYFALCHNQDFYFFGDAQDHKRLLNEDNGPNTGGMGAYTPTLLMSSELKQTIESTIIQPLLDQMNKESMPYTGFLYLGLILTPKGPKVLEFNVRLGDPEAQCLLHRLKSPFAQLCMSILDQEKNISIEWNSKKSFVLTLASKNYPYQSSKAEKISVKHPIMHNCRVYHCGTKLDQDTLLASGGRVLSLASLGDSYKEAAKLAYSCTEEHINFDGMQYRTDIGKQAIDEES